MSQSRAPIPVTSRVSRSSSTRTTRSQEPQVVQQEKRNNRRTTVCGDSDTLRYNSPTQKKTVPLKQNSLPTPKRSPSPAMSSSSSSSSSGKSFSSDSEVHTSPGQSSLYTPDSSPESTPKQQLGNASLTSLFDESANITAANAAIDDIIHRLVVCVKAFKHPSGLDFSATTEEQPLALADNDKNRPFINQLYKLAGLQNELAVIPTHGDKMLEDKVRKTEMPIRRALERMKEHQLKLYKQYATAFDQVPESEHQLGTASLPSLFDESTRITAANDANAAIDGIIRDLVRCVKESKAPSELDFSTTTKEQPLALADNEENRPFIERLRRLRMIRSRLAAIPTHGNPELEDRYQLASAAVDQAIQDMQEYKHKRWQDQGQISVNARLSRGSGQQQTVRS
ncbi:hypothetical protein RSOL_377390, partial [Rhizoctonia solani AG-3 Rhs1AP]